MLVSVEHLSKMQNVRAIVDDVSFAIEEKDRIALVGSTAPERARC